MKSILHLAVFLAFAMTAYGTIKTETIEYKEGETTLEGILVYDDAIANKRPGVLIAHQWKGLTGYERKRAEMLAELGYVAFALDIYGKGVRPADPKAAGELAGKYKADRPLLRRRAQAGLDQLKKFRQVDPQKIGAIGYCFGGTTVLELAR
ncbi:MAG TPA: dienelactone hydrolase family protein, partial [Verrucomicrobiae bacterium]|nr:dienelactone hydrolase family protein [Verrucomicrobiae bacterium]